MQYQSKRAEHTKLVLTMADRQGIDLQEMMLRAEFAEDAFETAVDRCVGCTKPGACARLLESNAQVPKLPDYCRNGDVFDALKVQ